MLFIVMLGLSWLLTWLMVQHEKSDFLGIVGYLYHFTMIISAIGTCADALSGEDSSFYFQMYTGYIIGSVIAGVLVNKQG
jgi:hypothetical protein